MDLIFTRRRGKEINKILKTGTGEPMSDTFFSYWGLIQSVNEDPAEYCLCPLSRAASVTLLSPKKNSPKPSSVVIDRSECQSSAPVTSLYPPLPRDPSLADMPLS